MIPLRLEIASPTGEIFRFSNMGDEQGKIESGNWTKNAGRRANSLDVEIADPELFYANSLPLPYVARNLQATVRCFRGLNGIPFLEGVLTAWKGSGLPGKMSLTISDKFRNVRRYPSFRAFSNVTAQALIESLIEEVNENTGTSLTADFTDADLSQTVYGQLVTAGQTAADIFESLCESQGHGFRVEGETAVFFRLRETSANTILYLGKDILNGFSFDCAELTRATTPNVRHFFDGSDTTEQSEENADDFWAPAPILGLNLQAFTTPSFDGPSLELANRAQKKRRELMKFNFPLVGFRTEIQPGSQVQVYGLGRRFDGIHFVQNCNLDFSTEITTIKTTNSGGDYVELQSERNSGKGIEISDKPR
jgi:hypothetical protein